MKNRKDTLIKSLVSSGAIKSAEVLSAFRNVEREKFVPLGYKEHAYSDEPLPTMEGQTISQPYTVAVMTEALRAGRGMKVLEIGAGSGYQAAILSHIVGASGKIITIERLQPLAAFARKNLAGAGYRNVRVIEGDGTLGHADEAPFDRIIVTASSPGIPDTLLTQLVRGGRMVIPVGHDLMVLEKGADGVISKKSLGRYRFVPLIGKHGHNDVSGQPAPFFIK